MLGARCGGAAGKKLAVSGLAVRGQSGGRVRIAETVTLAGGGLDRAAHLRRGEDALARLAAEPGATVIPLDSLRPAVGPAGLALLPPHHPIFAGAGEAVFLGLRDGAPVVARAVEGAASGPGGPWDRVEAVHPALPEAPFADLRAAMTRLAPVEAELATTARALLGWHAAHGFCARCGAPTVVAEAGWHRNCAACGARHFPRTDPVVIMLILRGNAVLVGRSPGWPEGMVSLLAGYVEPGETIEAAVRREVLEEAGVEVGCVAYLASQPWPYPSSLMIGCRGEALSEDITVDPLELDDAAWVTREEMVMVLAGAHPSIRPPRRGAIARFLLEAWLADRLA